MMYINACNADFAIFFIFHEFAPCRKLVFLIFPTNGKEKKQKLTDPLT